MLLSIYLYSGYPGIYFKKVKYILFRVNRGKTHF